MEALESDRHEVETAVSAHPSSIDNSKWQGLKEQIAELARQVEKIPAGRASPHEKISAPPSASSRAPSAASTSEISEPQVKIESLQNEPGQIVHFKGSLEGTDLQSAGIYRGTHKVRALELKRVAGPQRVNFDIQLANVQSGTVLRIYDRAGRHAEAEIALSAPAEPERAAAVEEVATPASAERRDRTIEIGGGVTSSPAPSGSSNVVLGGGMSDREAARIISEAGRDDSDSESSNTAEIPSSLPPSPSKAHLRSHKHDRLGDIQIKITELQALDPFMREYRVSGQIAGSGIQRAAIFVDGRPAGDIAVTGGDGFTTTSFNQTFEMNGHEAAIRVFGEGNNFIESSLRTGGIGTATGVYNANPNQLAIQISSVQPLAAGVYVVNGVISGRNLASAGLFQNGMMVQQINVSGGLLSSFAPSLLTRSVNFNAQFNPNAGMTTVRAFDSNGGSTEQPVIGGAIGSPYGINPYGNANPGYSGYNMNPYSRPAYGSPYGSPYASPYANQPPPSSSSKSKWWEPFLR